MRTGSSEAARNAAGTLAILAWLALLLQLWLSIRTTEARGGTLGDALVIYTGYFTILSNLFIAICATAMALTPGARAAGASPQGCATTAIVLVGIGYHLLLREIWDPQGWQRVADNMLHYAVPIAALAHWLVFPPVGSLAARAPLLWLSYPLAYFVYALVRGAWLGQYPYPFIDVATIGYARVFANASGLLLAFLATAALLRWSAVRRRG